MLKDSGVVFYPEQHTYFLGDKQLGGITSILSKHIFPNKYFDVPDHILHRAAERGSKIHTDLFTYDMFGIARTDEQKGYEKLKQEHNFKVLANEYLVTDFENYATAVDKVIDIDGKLYLLDVKTTYSLDKEYLSWQLSINKYLFNLVNPGIKVDGLKAIWIPKKEGTVTLHDVVEIPQEYVISLLEADKNGTEFINPLLPDEAKADKALSIIQHISRIAEEIKKLEAKKDEFNETIRKFMIENDINKWETDYFKISLSKDSFRERFDSKKLKEDDPDMYKKYVKQTAVKGRLTVTLKDENTNTGKSD